MCMTGILGMTLGMNCVGFLTQNINMFFGLLNQLTGMMFNVASGSSVVTGQGYAGFY